MVMFPPVAGITLSCAEANAGKSASATARMTEVFMSVLLDPTSCHTTSPSASGSKATEQPCAPFVRPLLYHMRSMVRAEATASNDSESLDAARHPAALSMAIARAWQPYRWRAYTVGIAAGMLAGGVIAPIATTSLLLGVYLTGIPLPADMHW